MSNKNAEIPSAAATSDDDGDLGAYLLQRLALQNQELEVDKMFRRWSSSKGATYTSESAAPDGSHKGGAASAQSGPD